MAVYDYPCRVTYDDIDNTIHLSLKGAMNIMQEAALLDAQRSGYSVTNVPDTGVVWLLVQWRIRMLEPCIWSEPLHVKTWPRTMERLKSERDFLVCKEDGTPVCKAESLWMLVNAHTGHPTRITPEIQGAYDLTEDRVFAEDRPPISGEPGDVICTYRVSPRDLDTNRHMNNRIYLDVARDALPAELQNKAFPEVTIRYHLQLLLGDTVCCRYRRGENCHIVNLTGEDPKHLHATVVFYE